MKKILMIIGSGASQNSWVPVVEALKSIYPEKYINKDNANYVFAKLIFEIRWLCYQVRANSSQSKLVAKKLEYLQVLKNLKNEISIKLSIAQEKGDIFPDSKVLKYLQDNYLKDNPTALISVNWDTLFEKGFGEKSQCYLHGSIKDKNLYLPSETTEDEYRLPEEKAFFGKNMGICMNEITNADEVIIYGLSFSPLDAELGTIWSEGIYERSRPLKIYILNKEPKPIINTLKFLDSKSEIEEIDFSTM
jgi:hypothetical protein